MKVLIRSCHHFLINFGIDVSKLFALKFLPRFVRNRFEWLQQGGEITRSSIILSDFADRAGVASGHYFHQDLLVARFIFERCPVRHIDVGSRIDGFVAHVASFREIEVFDIRPLEVIGHPSIKFTETDFTVGLHANVTDSLSCLHAIEHFGLGRYSDPIDVNGHSKGITNLVNLLSAGGHLYLSFPIARNDEVHFNAHRVFHPLTILNDPTVKKGLKLLRFDYIDDVGDLHSNIDVFQWSVDVNYGCGIYTFEKL